MPHFIDSALLGSAIALAVILNVSPLRDAWLAAKIGALIAYIGLGSVALRRSRTKKQKAVAFAAALCVVTYIVLAAVTWSALPLG
ncbi:SirB2 family protein [Niveibacterium sp. 24ML]|uniref:SirB2 family protein n=1 Tax=Niveibacterium sp. 24ML TaxID=2985512 RepID=UPI0022722AD4|nr:SirB2 family protein [Niveibacterium sp. 24ML]MCX9157035.1 SirB2 family protein [Niveibacterium sp. 24ML]